MFLKCISIQDSEVQLNKDMRMTLDINLQPHTHDTQCAYRSHADDVNKCLPHHHALQHLHASLQIVIDLSQLVHASTVHTLALILKSIGIRLNPLKSSLST